MYVDAPGTSPRPELVPLTSPSSALPAPPSPTRPRPATSCLHSSPTPPRQQHQRPQQATLPPAYSSSRSLSVSWVLACVVLLCSALVSPAMAGVALYPYGRDAGDRQTERIDDGGSGPVRLGQGFTYYGKNYPVLFVNNNGVISFKQELRGYRPKPFPLEDVIIAPYWADVDIDKVGGDVWFRETTKGEDLQRASEDVQSYSSQFRRFRARWVFVATWDDVGFYGASSIGKNKTNTFQCVLVCDGTRSFAIFLYETLQWTTGSNSQGNSDTGLGGNAAQAGFNGFNDDGVIYHTLEGAGNSSVLNLTTTSNICSPGKWIFRVDSPQIALDSGSLLLEPASGSSLGGYELTITGPCFSSDTADNSVRGLIVDTGVTFPCERRRAEGGGEGGRNSSRTVHCVMPTVFVTGDVTVSLLASGQRLNYTGVFSFVSPGLSQPSIVRHSPQDWVAGRRVRVSWQPSSQSDLDLNSAVLEVMTFKQDGGKPRLETSWQVVMGADTSLRDMELLLPPMTHSTLALVTIRVPYPLINGSYLSYWSDVFPVRWSSAQASDAWCSNWLTDEYTTTSTTTTTTSKSRDSSCPCTSKQADSDTGRWQKDWLCSGPGDARCIYRGAAASQCFMSTFNGSQTENRLCCYDSKRELLNLGEGGGGSMVERLHLTSQSQRGQGQGDEVVAWFSYLAQEVAPFLHCCQWGANASLCPQFSLLRPQLSCQGYTPPAAAQAAGDPHIVTLDGLEYTFNGIGDFVLLQDTTGSIAIHAHTDRARDIDGQLGNATLFKAVAMTVVNQTQVLEVRKGEQGEGGQVVTVLLDHQEMDITASPTELPGMTVYRNVTGNSTVDMTVVLDTVGISVLVSATPDLLNVMVLVGSPELKGNLEGLLGNYNGVKDDDLRSRQGGQLPPTANMSDIHYLFGMTWAVPKNQSLLYRPGDQGDSDSESLADTEYVPVFLDTISDKDLRNGTAELCGDNLQCKFDFQMTGIEAIGQSTKQFSDRYQSVREEIAPVVRCPYIEPLVMGNRSLEGQAVGDTVTFACDPGHTLTNGTSLLVCLDTGKWSGTVPDCVVDLSDTSDDTLLYIAVGSAFGGFVVVIVCAVLLVWAVRKCRRKYIAKVVDTGSEPEHFEMPMFFDPSATPNPVFENPLFLSSLQNLGSDDGRFQIPRPRYVDPNIYTEYF